MSLKRHENSTERLENRFSTPSKSRIGEPGPSTEARVRSGGGTNKIGSFVFQREERGIKAVPGSAGEQCPFRRSSDNLR